VSLHDQLLEARERAGMTQDELSEKTGIAQPHISAYECGHHAPSVETLTLLIAALGVRIRYRNNELVLEREET
jgi:transcriptional regulator with XRE-family HTH domain